MAVFGDPATWPDQDLIGWSEELDVPMILAAYTEGVFPMPLDLGHHGDDIGWFSPLARGVLLPGTLKVARSLRKTAHRYTTTIDTAFDRVLAGCADPARPDGWIDERIRATYTALHEAGIVHSVETWNDAGELVGGLYGVGLGGLFAGESMFHTPAGRDASKVALMRLVDALGPNALLDVQWRTDHLATLGVVEIPRADYLARLADALDRPGPDWAASAGVRRA